jgi:hypothetical protein
MFIFFFFFFFTVEGEGVEVNVFFFPRCMKRWKEEGKRGTFRVFRNVFFIVEWLGRGSPGVISFYKFIMGWGKGCTGGKGAG